MIFDGILETTTTTGVGDVTMSAVTGRPRFTDVFTANATKVSADPFYYAITTQDSPPQFLEHGVGYCSAAGTLKRSYVITTYSGGAYDHTGTAATLPSGTKNVICTGGSCMVGSNAPDIAAVSSVKRIGPPHYGALVSSGTFTKDRLHYIPMFFSTEKRLKALRMVCGSTAGTSPTRGFHLGLYSMLENGLPGRRIVESGDIITSGSYIEQAYTLGSVMRLPPGWYYAALVHDFAGTNPQVYYTSSVAGFTPLGYSSSGGNMHCYEALSASWTTMPTTASATPTVVAGGNYSPLMMLEVE